MNAAADITKAGSSSTDTAAAANSNMSNSSNSNNSNSTIRILPQVVVDRIAAGEVVQRPAAAIKELCENSLDADATQIRVVVHHNSGSSNGGLDQFSVHDNGRGISKQDLPLACARHATSKLASADDLHTIQSFGFRGEALASLSAVARVAIVSRTARTAAAYRLQYADGKPLLHNNNNNGQQQQQQQLPAPTARTVGTTVHCRDLFYNVPGRRRSSSSSDEYRAVLRMLQCYALHCAGRGVAFQLQKQGGSSKNSSNNNNSKTDLNTATAVEPLQRLLVAAQQKTTKNACSSGNNSNDKDNSQRQDDGGGGGDDPAESKQQQKQQHQKLQAARDHATQQVIAQIYGSQLLPHLLPLSSELYGREDNDDGSGGNDNDDHVAVQVSDEEKKEEFFVSSSTQHNNDNHNYDATASQKKKSLIYTCTGFVTSPSFHQVATAAASGAAASTGNKNKGLQRRGSGSNRGVVLFINHRLVDGCAALKRSAVDDAYAEFLGGAPQKQQKQKQKPPLVYLSLHVPPAAIDVNVHPTKREVTLLHCDRIARHLREALRATLQAAGQSFVAANAATAPKQSIIKNPYAKQSQTQSQSSSSNNTAATTTTTTTTSESRKRPAPAAAAAPEEDSTDREPNTVADSQQEHNLQQQQAPPPAKQQKKSMVRTSRATQSGALEPYLVPRTTQLSQQQSSSQSSFLSQSSMTACEMTQQSQNLTPTETASPSSSSQHAADCPLSASPSTTPTMDLSQPGAFALAAAQCNCRAASRTISDNSNNEDASVTIRLPRQALGGAKKLRLQRLAPKPCQFTSVRKLRQRIDRQRSAVWEKRLRSACFVGTVSHDRSLVQCGEALVLLHHGALAEELFTQLALNSFGGGCGVARLHGGDGGNNSNSNNNAVIASTANEATNSATAAIPEVQDAQNNNSVGIDIAAVVGSFVQFEDIMQNSPDLEEPPSLPVTVSETNHALAEQVADCLLQQAEMLLEYFSIEITKDNQGRARLTGLPVLLEGYEPSPHGLPLFLLRLATEVNWSEERPCFAGVCRELGAYYAQLPSTAPADQHAARVRHTIFPAVSTLLVPTESMVKGNSSSNNQDSPPCFTVLTTLPKLYKVFERC